MRFRDIRGDTDLPAGQIPATPRKPPAERDDDGNVVRSMPYNRAAARAYKYARGFLNPLRSRRTRGVSLDQPRGHWMRGAQ